MTDKILLICGRYEGGMRDFHLSLAQELREQGHDVISLVNLTRAMPDKTLREEHTRHGIDNVISVDSSNWYIRQMRKALPLFLIKAMAEARKAAPTQIILTDEAYCFWAAPASWTRHVSVFYHDPDPHESAQQGRKARLENGYKAWVHEKKTWKSVLVGSKAFQEPVSRRAASPVEWMRFPTFTRALFPEGTPPPDLPKTPYILLYGRVDRYKGTYDWLQAQAQNLANLPPVVIAGRVADDRVMEFADRVQFINRFIDYTEIASLFSSACAVVLPYRSVTNSGIGDIALSFDTPIYIPDLPYFTERYSDEPRARPLASLYDDLTTAS